ncbi:MAG TPA: ArsI/CadI family heavy metal resistance metalloenzyme [Calditerricola sp.]
MSRKTHVAIHVRNLDASLDFYRRLFGVEPVKVRPGYAKFDLNDPPLNFTLNEGGDVRGGINHFGIQVRSTEEVLAAKARLTEAGLKVREEMDTVCCYARQDKIWVTSPDGHEWEVFVVKGDADVARSSRPASACCAAESEAGAKDASSSCC